MAPAPGLALQVIRTGAAAAWVGPDARVVTAPLQWSIPTRVLPAVIPPALALNLAAVVGSPTLKLTAVVMVVVTRVVTASMIAFAGRMLVVSVVVLPVLRVRFTLAWKCSHTPPFAAAMSTRPGALALPTMKGAARADTPVFAATSTSAPAAVMFTDSSAEDQIPVLVSLLKERLGVPTAPSGRRIGPVTVPPLLVIGLCALLYGIFPYSTQVMKMMFAAFTVPTTKTLLVLTVYCSVATSLHA